jgi:hypothetical protein
LTFDLAKFWAHICSKNALSSTGCGGRFPAVCLKSFWLDKDAERTSIGGVTAMGLFSGY